jgi:hypothetical protein
MKKSTQKCGTHCNPRSGLRKGVYHIFEFNSGVHIFNRPIRNEPIKSLGFKIEYTPRSVVQLVNIFNCLAYDWMVKGK